MANTFFPEPIDGGDIEIWGPKELRQNKISKGIMSAKIYDDSGDLKLTVGQIGFDNGSGYGVTLVDTVTTIDISGITASRWFTVELTRVGSTPSFAAFELATDQNPYDLPASIATYYDAEKGGYYRVPTARIVGFGWKATGGTLAGVLNVDSVIEGYSGYSTGEIIGHVYRWDKRLDDTVDDNDMGKLHLIPVDERPSNFVLDAGTSTSWVEVDFSTYVPKNVKALLLECFLKMTGDGARDVEYLYARPSGSSETNIYRTRVCSVGFGNAGAGQNVYADNTLPVRCDSDGKIEYSVSNAATATAYITIFGYYIK